MFWGGVEVGVGVGLGFWILFVFLGVVLFDG